jgi:hypothetical protein
MMIASNKMSFTEETNEGYEIWHRDTQNSREHINS